MKMKGETAMQNEAAVKLDCPAPGVLRLAIDRPEVRNALNPQVRERLADAVDAAMRDPAVRALILTGHGGQFCAGGDLAGLAALPESEVGALLQRGHRLLRVLIEGAKPVVAAVEGSAAGGGMGLALAADLVVMGRSARFVLPFFRIGLVPDYGVIWSMARRAGPGAARRLALLAAPVAADQALTLGLADQVVDDDKVQQAALETAELLARHPPQALAWTKRLANAQPASLAESLTSEIEAQSACFGSASFKDGVAAFLGRRGGGRG